MSISKSVEEMNIYGVTVIGKFLSDEQIAEFKNDLEKKKQEDIEEFGEEHLLEFDYEHVRDLGRFGGIYYKLLENPILNNYINNILNDKAVVHSYNAIINHQKHSSMVGYQFHRDQPFFKDTRTSVIVMIPLVDYSNENGSTEYVPTTHLFEKIPSEEFMKEHYVSTSGKAGEAYMVDAALWHRAGINKTDRARPMIVIKYTLAPFKQQVDYVFSSGRMLDSASDLVKQRLGWNVRVCQNYVEFREPGHKRKFKSGQYDMSNVYIR